MRSIRSFFLLLCLSVGQFGCRSSSPEQQSTIRVGHFPNITHAQALVAHALSRQGRGWFEERLGPGVKIEWFVYNAGPSAMEALFAKSIDFTYVGPSPALNAYTKSQGAEVRIVAGAAEGGAALVVQGSGPIKAPPDFRGKKIATPQLGNTQDVSCRAWLLAQGFHVTQLGGDVSVIPTANPDQLSLFQNGTLDGVWTVEPWVSRLELEAGGRIFLEEQDTITTVLVSSAEVLQARRELVQKFVRAHSELTEWISLHADEAKLLVASELKEETTRDMSAGLLSRSWSRLRLTDKIEIDSLKAFVQSAQKVGFLKEAPDLGRLIEVP